MGNGNSDCFFCYSLRLFHFLSAFGEKCATSKIHPVSGCRYWIFTKSTRLDELIKFWNEVKHKYN